MGADTPAAEPANMVDVAQVVADLGSPGRGFERVELLRGSSLQDCSTVVVIPTRGKIDFRVVQRWQSLISPMNQKRAVLFAAGDEVGKAYDRLISQILADPNLSSWRYLLTLEDDNLPPPDAHVRLLESIEWGPRFDAMSGIYWTKGDIQMPMAYGDPDEYERTGVLDFRPRDVKQALQRGNLMPVNGIAMGCALWRLDLFREIPPPWFVTVNDFVPGQGAAQMTQDLFFCQQARQRGKRFGVDLRVKVGHLDTSTGIVY